MKVYFPNLNTLRLIAAILVVIHHVEQFKDLFSFESYWGYPFINVIGKLGVILFFVLSGFLITFLLLAEEKSTNTISIKNFYIRRILRIWPLYFLILLLSFVILPQIDFFTLPGHDQSYWLIKIILFIFFLPNLVLALGGGVAYASQSWSIGTEEQFYILWPILIKHIKKRKVLLLSIISIYLIIKLLLFLLPDYESFNVMRSFWLMFCIDCMAIGGLFALFGFNNNKTFSSIVTNKFVQIVVWLSTIGLIAGGVHIPYFHYEAYATLFAIIIFNLALNKASLVQLENKYTNYLGKISYGIYMFHPLAIGISIKLLIMGNVYSSTFLYICSIILTILFSAASYHFFEKRFFKLKTKYSSIISGDNAKIGEI